MTLYNLLCQRISKVTRDYKYTQIVCAYKLLCLRFWSSIGQVVSYIRRATGGTPWPLCRVYTHRFFQASCWKRIPRNNRFLKLTENNIGKKHQPLASNAPFSNCSTNAWRLPLYLCFRRLYDHRTLYRIDISCRPSNLVTSRYL